MCRERGKWRQTSLKSRLERLETCRMGIFKLKKNTLGDCL